MSEPKWLEIARSDLGIEEIAGPKANPRIMSFYKAANANWAKDDAVPWCGAAMAAWITTAGFPCPAEAARARSWLDWGVPLDQPKKGAVVILKRGTDEKNGHVTLYIEDKGDRILCLGGNQGDAVSITSYPKRDVLGYRWPTGADVPKHDTPAVKPLTKSGTIWGGAAGGVAAAGAYADQTVKTGMEVVAEITTMSPIKGALLDIGANSKAVALALGVFATILVISRRVKAKLEGLAG